MNGRKLFGDLQPFENGPRIESGGTGGEEKHRIWPALLLVSGFDWRVRGASAHPLKRLPDGAFADVCRRLNQIIQLVC
jgi:hypothetical protein